MRPRFFLSSSKTWILEKNDTPPKVESSGQLSGFWETLWFSKRYFSSEGNQWNFEGINFLFSDKTDKMESIGVKGWKVRDGMLRTIRVKV